MMKWWILWKCRRILDEKFMMKTQRIHGACFKVDVLQIFLANIVGTWKHANMHMKVSLTVIKNCIKASFIKGRGGPSLGVWVPGALVCGWFWWVGARGNSPSPSVSDCLHWLVMLQVLALNMACNCFNRPRRPEQHSHKGGNRNGWMNVKPASDSPSTFFERWTGLLCSVWREINFSRR